MNISWLQFMKEAQTQGNWQIPDELIEHLRELLSMEHQSVYHNETIWEHTDAVTQVVKSMQYDQIFPELNQGQQDTIANILAVAALLHDVAKPSTATMNKKYICTKCNTHNNNPQCKQCQSSDFIQEIPNMQYIGHERKGAEEAKQFLGFIPTELHPLITSLIKGHMGIGSMISADKMKYSTMNKAKTKLDKRWDDRGQFQWITPEIFAKMAYMLSIADHVSRISDFEAPNAGINSLMETLDHDGEIDGWETMDSIPIQQISEAATHIVNKLAQEYGRPEEKPAKQPIPEEIPADKLTQIQEISPVDITGLTTKNDILSTIAKAGHKDVIPEILAILS